MSTVEELVARSREAQKQFEFATQEQADAAARAVCKAVYDNQEMLGKMAAEESRMTFAVRNFARLSTSCLMAHSKRVLLTWLRTLSSKERDTVLQFTLTIQSMLSTVESIAQYLGVSLTSQQVQPVAEARQTDTLRQQHLVVDHGVTTASVVTLTTST